MMDAFSQFKDLILQPEREDAAKRLADPAYWGSSGDSVMRAVVYADLAMNRVPRASTTALAPWLVAITASLEDAVREFRALEDDPDGYGVATLHACIRRVQAFKDTACEQDADA